MSKVRLLIEIDEEYYRSIKEQGSFSTTTYQGILFQSIVDGTPITDDMISRNRAVTLLNEAQVEYDEYYKGLGKAKTIIDNMTAIDEV